MVIFNSYVKLPEGSMVVLDCFTPTISKGHRGTHHWCKLCRLVTPRVCLTLTFGWLKPRFEVKFFRLGGLILASFRCQDFHCFLCRFMVIHNSKNHPQSVVLWFIVCLWDVLVSRIPNQIIPSIIPMSNESMAVRSFGVEYLLLIYIT